MLKGLEAVIQQEQPDMILVHGDTMTAFASSLAAFYNQVAIGHVEAGLRTWNKYSPYPEEMNRQMISKLADLHFAPTAQAKMNLLNENTDASKIAVTGNTAIDAMATTIQDNYHSEVMERHKGKRVLLLTAHRRENLGKPMEHIFSAVRLSLIHI